MAKGVKTTPQTKVEKEVMDEAKKILVLLSAATKLASGKVDFTKSK